MENQIGKKQFTNAIIIDAPIQKVWKVIDRSEEMVDWGPPVTQVDFLSDDQGNEEVGSVRKVYAEFGKKSGTLTERRTIRDENQRLDYQIFDETFGLGKMLKNMGFSMELRKINHEKTELAFSFYQDARGFGIFLHGMIKNQQNKNNLAALSSIKQYIENKK